MSKLLQKQVETAVKKWEDTITEEQVIKKFSLGKTTLRDMRKAGRIKNYRYLLPSKPGSKVPGKKLVYSLTELTELFCPAA